MVALSEPALPRWGTIPNLRAVGSPTVAETQATSPTTPPALIDRRRRTPPTRIQAKPSSSPKPNGPDGADPPPADESPMERRAREARERKEEADAKREARRAEEEAKRNRNKQ